ncbi:MAG TPA: type II toxin-antitoxin system HicB family antitoxin [Segetibacter sp.]|jgi:predicted RNase H-like HicB family nuclease
MKTVKIIIERGKDNYASYSENVEGVYGSGDSAEEAKQNALEAIELLKKYNEDENIPLILKGNYEVVYEFITKSNL